MKKKQERAYGVGRPKPDDPPPKSTAVKKAKMAMLMAKELGDVDVEADGVKAKGIMGMFGGGKKASGTPSADAGAMQKEGEEIPGAPASRKSIVRGAHSAERPVDRKLTFASEDDSIPITGNEIDRQLAPLREKLASGTFDHGGEGDDPDSLFAGLSPDERGGSASSVGVRQKG